MLCNDLIGLDYYYVSFWLQNKETFLYNVLFCNIFLPLCDVIENDYKSM